MARTTVLFLVAVAVLFGKEKYTNAFNTLLTYDKCEWRSTNSALNASHLTLMKVRVEICSFGVIFYDHAYVPWFKQIRYSLSDLNLFSRNMLAINSLRLSDAYVRR